MPETSLRDYDEVPYESRPTRQTHPNRLAMIATLFGMKPAPVGRCRVLELGCASGGNLIPMAVAYPGSRFVGIDLSKRQTEEGRAAIEELGLKNIKIGHVNLMSVDQRFGQFDYIIAHGLFSWVPRNAQDKILDITTKHLSPQGVAYVDYNTFPGWHRRGMLRDMLCYHAATATEPLARVRASRQIADFLARNATHFQGPHAESLKRETDVFGKFPDWYVLHEHLGPFNKPIYFHQFAEQAAARGLQYIGEAQGSPTGAIGVPPQVDSELREMGADLIRREQYLDFLTDRAFRRTLLCKGDVELQRPAHLENISQLYVASSLQAAAPVSDYRSPQPQRFKNEKGIEATVSYPMIKSALFYLSTIYPRSMRFDELLAVARQRLGQAPPAPDLAAQEQTGLAKSLLDCYVVDAVELTASPDAFTTEISERPVASPYARRQARDGLFVANLRHDYVQIDEASRHVLPLLDGTHDRASLTAALEAGYTPGAGAPPSLSGGGPPTAQAFVAAVDEVLGAIARTALLLK